MSRKPKNTPAEPNPQAPKQQYAVPNDAEWGGFINIRLDEEQKELYFSWLRENATAAPALFLDMLGEGIKATLSFDLEHSTFIVAITGSLLGSAPGKRFVSTSRSADLNDAIALTVWKHIVLTRGDYGNYRPKDSSWMSWG